MMSCFQMRKKLKESEASGDEKKDADEADEQKKSSSPSREEPPAQYLDSASGPPPGYCSHYQFMTLLRLCLEALYTVSFLVIFEV